MTVLLEAERPAPFDRPARPRVALAGCGVVGGGVLARLQADQDIEIVAVLVRDPAKPRDPAPPRDLLVTDPGALLAREPDVVLDCLSDAPTSLALLRAALARGVDAISASKQAVAADTPGLTRLAADARARLFWSASVGGGAPAVETVRAAREHGPVVYVEGVLNGTTNYLLTRLEQGASPSAALAAAQAAGFAEADPTADVSGGDAAAKIRLLAFDAFGYAPKSVATEALDLAAPPSPKAGAVVRQIASCGLDSDGRTVASVRLDADCRDPLFAGLQGEENALRVVCADGTTFACRGRGAGRDPTADSLYGDLCRLLDGDR